MAKVSFNQQRKYNPDYSSVISPYQTAIKMEVFNAAGTTKLYEVLYPLGGADFDLSLASGSYVFKATILDTVTSGNLSVALVDEVAGSAVFNSGSNMDENNKVYTSPAVSVNNDFFNLKIFQSSSFVSSTPVADFAVSYALGVCTGIDPNKKRRANFTFANHTTPLEISTDNVSFVIFNPNGFYREGDVGTTVTYYFKDANGETDNVTITFSDCATPPPAAPTLSTSTITTAGSVTLTFSGGPGTIKVYEGNTVRQTMTNQSSPLNFTPNNINAGQFTFSFTNANGESSKSAVLTVQSDGGGGFCSLQHLDALCEWQEPTQGPFQIKAIKFSNSGSYAWAGQIVTSIPLTFILRGKNILTRSDVALASGISTFTVDCLSGNATEPGGLTEPAGFPMPPGYEKVGNVYQPIGTVVGNNVTKRIKANVTNFCTASASTVQIGITNNYTSQAPNVSEVVTWKDGLEADVLVQDGAYPWIFVRDKNNPTNVSEPTKTKR